MRTAASLTLREQHRRGLRCPTQTHGSPKGGQADHHRASTGFRRSLEAQRADSIIRKENILELDPASLST
jgi:hypothetical protein